MVRLRAVIVVSALCALWSCQKEDSCPVRSLGCDCGPADMCDTGLVCTSGICTSQNGDPRIGDGASGDSLGGDTSGGDPTMEPLLVDVLLVVDNSVSMAAEITRLTPALDDLITGLDAIPADYQVGIVTPDIDCNLPDCASAQPGEPCRDCATGGTNAICCASPPSCQDVDGDSNGTVDESTCDGGRLRFTDTTPRFVTPSSAATATERADLLRMSVNSLGLAGTAYEAGLESARIAIGCAVGTGCPSDAAADLNTGFIRSEAMLLLVIVSDEDDCSFRDRTAYQQLSDTADPGEQASTLCSPTECYAHFVINDDMDGDDLMDWADRVSPPRLQCGSDARVVNPPLPDAIATIVDDLVAFKGGDVGKLAATLLGGVSQGASPLASGCFADTGGSSTQCGCSDSSSSSLFCELTQATGGEATRTPSSPLPPGGGCQGLPAGRYLSFLQELSSRQTIASGTARALARSVCEPDFSATLSDAASLLIP